MLAARAVLYAIVISLLISLMCGLLISADYLNQLQFNEYNAQLKAIEMVGNAIGQLRLDDRQAIEKQGINLYGSGKDSMQIEKFNWGLFTAIAVQSIVSLSTGSDTIQKMALLGLSANENGGKALHLVDTKRPLVLLGNSEIVGDMAIPAAGISAGNVMGKNYTGRSLVNGQKTVSTPFFPSLVNEKLDNVIRLLENVGGAEDAFSSTHHSFANAPLRIKGSQISLDDVELKGRIIITASERIYIKRNSNIEDVILIAPEIEIEAGTEIKGQFFATRKLIVGDNCQLKYPSVIALIAAENSPDEMRVELGASIRMDGMLLLHRGTHTLKKLKLLIDDRFTLFGDLIANGAVELKQAEVFGSVVAHSFELSNQAGTVYSNHLLDVKINPAKRPDHFALPRIFSATDKENKIIKWLK